MARPCVSHLIPTVVLSFSNYISLVKLSLRFMMWIDEQINKRTNKSSAELLESGLRERR